MFYFKHTVSFLIASFFVFTSWGQLNPTWSTDLTGSLNWHRVMASGSYLVASGDGLSAYDQATGSLLWNNAELSGIAEDNVSELGVSPLLMTKHNDNISVIDPFTGTVLFNSRSQSIADMKYQTFLPKSNSIVVAGDDTEGQPVIASVDAGSGKVNWKLNEKFGRIISINEANEKELIISTLFYVYKLKSSDGSTIWKRSTTAGGDEIADSPLGGLMQGLAEEMTKDMEFVIRFYQNTKEDVFVIASEHTHRTTGSDGKVQESFSNDYMTFRLSTGEPIWSDKVGMKGKLGDLAFLNGGVLILPDDGNKTTINFFPLTADASGQWGKKGRGTKIKGGVYKHINVKNGILLVSAAGSNTFLDILNPSTGEMLYDKPVKVSGQVQATMDTPQGVLYVTSEEANIIEPASGNQVLGKSIQTSAALTHIEGMTLYVFDLKSSSLKKVDLNTASITDFSSGKLKLEGKEDPTSIEFRDGKVLVMSSQNLALFNADGSLAYQAYHAPPKVSGLQKALLYAQAARAAYIGANAYTASAALQTVETDDAVAGAMVDGIGMAYQEVGDQASDFVKKSVAQARERASATVQGRDFSIVLGATGKTNSLLKVNKTTGEADAAIDLGSDKDPKYAVDDVTGRVFLLNGNKLEMYQL